MRTKVNFLVTVLTILVLSSCALSKKTGSSSEPPPGGNVSNASTEVHMPCLVESYDGEDYMADLGISDGRTYMSDAKEVSFLRAKQGIMQKYIGSYKNAIRSYQNDTHVPSGKKRDMSKIEGGVLSVVENVINAYAKTVCFQMMQDRDGNYTAYTAIHVPLSGMHEKVADQLETLEVDYMENKFWEEVNKAFDEQQKTVKNEHKEIEAFGNGF